MVVVSEVEIAADGFALETALPSDHEVTVDAERIVPASGRTMPYLRVEGTGLSSFDAALRRCRSVREVTEVDRTRTHRRYRVEWSDDVERRLAGFDEFDATVLAARASDRWRFRIRFPSHEALSGFHDYFEGTDLGVTIDTIRSGTDRSADEADLTEPQRRLLDLALRRGYFEIPRETTLTDLADEVGVSTQAASERLRRATTTVLESELVDSGRSFEADGF